MRGLNYWSESRNNLLVLQVRIQNEEIVSAEQLAEAGKRLTELNPPLHNLSPYSSLVQLTAQIAVELQCLAGMECIHHEVKETGQPFVFHLIFSYTLERAGRYAAKAAVRITEVILDGSPYNLQKDIEALKQIKMKDSLGPSTQAIADEARRRNIPVKRLDSNSLLLLGQGKNQRTVRATIADSTSSIAVEMASNKERTKNILKDGYIPVPEGGIAETTEELRTVIGEIGFPLAVKPLNGNHGRGITTNINSVDEAERAFFYARKVSDEVIIEKHIAGKDYRLLIINYKLTAAALRNPPEITGDGISTIGELVEQLNLDPSRGNGHENILTRIRIDAATRTLLAASQLTEQSVLPRGVRQQLKLTANISTGGTSKDVTALVHPHNKFLAERAARLMNLDICGIDIMAEDIAVPITGKNGAVLEINAAPGLRMHQSPSAGSARNPAASIIDLLFPGKAEARIPVVAVTGTNGKTTTTRLIARLMKQNGKQVGYTTTDGIYIQDTLITVGDCSGPESAALVLRDPVVDFAVLECARGGILRAGLGFDQADVAVVTNISNDHLGMDGINTTAELAKVKAVVPASVHRKGYAVLNAADDLVYQMKESLSCQIALFCLDADNTRIIEHCKNGYPAAFINEGYFTIFDGTKKIPVARIEDVPITQQGKSECMIKNVLAAILAAFICKAEISTLRSVLQQFSSSPENTPGRMNHFYFSDFTVLVDYMHNEDGYKELKKYASQLKTTRKYGIIAAVPDRQDNDIITMGQQAAEIFDEIIIRHDSDNRGRKNEEINALLITGIRNVSKDIKVRVISNEFEAINYAFEHAEKDSWIFINTENAYDTIHFIENKRVKYEPAAYH